MLNRSEQPKPIELCLERLGATDDRYVRCTARVGRAAGLALGSDGRILWCEQDGGACELWVSADHRLMAFCLAGAAVTTLHRAGRVLTLPAERPVVLRHHDELELAGTRFRLHVHGVTDRTYPPTVVKVLARAAAATALALAVGGVVDCSHPLKRMPDAAGGLPDAALDASTLKLLGADAGAVDTEPPDGGEIEVLESPPIIP